VNEPSPLAIGSIFLKKYKVLELIGRGGYAWVYRAQHLYTGKLVAIKIVRRPGGNTSDVIRRTIREATFQSNKRHKNIVEVFDTGVEEDGTLYIVMELLEGRTLAKAIELAGKLHVLEALTIAEEIASGLDHAHAEGVIHRDVKPQNVFLPLDGTTKVLDFGVAKIDNGDQQKITLPRMIVGTAYYMSPEQILGETVTTQSDIYALGVVLDEMLIGENYIERIARRKRWMIRTIDDVTKIVVSEHGEPLHELDPRIPSHVQRIVDRCMAKALHQRFASMLEVLGACRASRARILAESPELAAQCRDLATWWPVDHTPGRPAPYVTGGTLRSPDGPQGDTEPLTHVPFTVETAAPPGERHAPMVVLAPVHTVGDARHLPTKQTGVSNGQAFVSASTIQNPLVPQHGPTLRMFSGRAPAAPPPVEPERSHTSARVEPTDRHSAPPAQAAPAVPPRVPVHSAAPEHAEPVQRVRATPAPARAEPPAPATRAVVEAPAAPRTARPAAPLRTPAKKSVTPSTVPPVSSTPPPKPASSKLWLRVLTNRLVVAGALLGPVLVGGATLLYLRVQSASSATTRGEDEVIVESVVVAPPLPSPHHGSPVDPALIPPPPPADEVPDEVAVAAPAKANPPPGTTTAPVRRSTVSAAPTARGGFTVFSLPSSAPRAKKPLKDDMDENFRILDQQLEQERRNQ
jgi:serine/threonine protein kinase